MPIIPSRQAEKTLSMAERQDNKIFRDDVTRLEWSRDCQVIGVIKPYRIVPRWFSLRGFSLITQNQQLRVLCNSGTAQGGIERLLLLHTDVLKSVL